MAYIGEDDVVVADLDGGDVRPEVRLFGAIAACVIDAKCSEVNFKLDLYFPCRAMKTMTKWRIRSTWRCRRSKSPTLVALERGLLHPTRQRLLFANIAVC